MHPHILWVWQIFIPKIVERKKKATIDFRFIVEAFSIFDLQLLCHIYGWFAGVSVWTIWFFFRHTISISSLYCD